MPTAYIKRLQQFVRQCDRLNYPSQMSSSAKKMQLHKQKQQLMLQASLRQNMYHQQQQLVKNNAGNKKHSFPKVFNRSGAMGYSPQDGSPFLAMPATAGTTAFIPTVTSKPSKQRKQKGTLVMRSCPDHNVSSTAPVGSLSPTPLPMPQGKHLRRSASSTPNITKHASNRSHSNGSNFHLGGGGSTAMNNWAPAAPSHHISATQHQQALHQQQQAQTQLDQYAANMNHTRYRRSMGTGAVLRSPPPTSPQPPSQRPSAHSQIQTPNHRPQWQQFSQQRHLHQPQQQQQPVQYHPHSTTFSSSSPGGGGGVKDWQ